jgi:hypothetical protein
VPVGSGDRPARLDPRVAARPRARCIRAVHPYPQLTGLDFRTAVPRLEVPVYVLDGLAELDGRRDVMLE